VIMREVVGVIMLWAGGLCWGIGASTKD